ncbi:MAG: TRIC cation channel family protein [Halothiobacillaceae bacterium]
MLAGLFAVLSTDKTHARVPGLCLRGLLHALWLLCLVLSMMPRAQADALESAVSGRVLAAGWSQQPPYQFLETQQARQYPAGLDIVLLNRIAREAGVAVRYEYRHFADSLSALQRGEVEIIPGAYASADREQYAWISRPYRRGYDRLFVGPGARMPADAPAPELIEQFTRDEGPLAVVSGFDWLPPVQRTLDEAAARGDVILTDSLSSAAQLVASGEAAGYVADQLAGMIVAHHVGLSADRIHPRTIQERDIHLIFSREAVDRMTFERFDDALERLTERGELDAITRQFTGPIAISIALERSWFYWLVILGIISFSISGVIIARTGNYSVFGALVLAALPALGGGVLRDILLLREIYLIPNPELALICLVIIALGYLFNRVLERVRGRALWFFDLVALFVRLRRRLPPNLVLQIFDALGLAAFTGTAVSVVAEKNIQPLWLWGPIFAAITASGGVFLRDMIRNDAVNPYLHDVVYGEVALVWALGLSLYLELSNAATAPLHVFTAILVTMAGIFITRMLFLACGWRAPRY